MEYAFVGFLIPVLNENDANMIINQIDCILLNSECDLSNAYHIAGIPVLDNVSTFGKDLEQFLAQHSQKLYNNI